MTIDSIDVTEAIANVEDLLRKEQTLSPALIAAIQVILLVVKLLTDRIGLNSRNSSKPPSSDFNRDKSSRNISKNKIGGQFGHKGSLLQPVSDPDEIKWLNVNSHDLGKDHSYEDLGFEKRQVINIRLSRHVIEFRAQILQNENGQRCIADFPAGVTRPIQYGASVKAHAVYLSLFQLLPYERVETHFSEQFGMSLSTGSLVNFNREVYGYLALFESIACRQLANSDLIHADETGINVNGKGFWLHNASNEKWTLLAPHKKRGRIAMDDIGILQNFSGVLCHDHWKPYYQFSCLHALCNAHHLRELTRAFEQDGQEWAEELHRLLNDMNNAVIDAGGVLAVEDALAYRKQYQAVLDKADIECPAPESVDTTKKRGRQKRSRSRNLLERLRNYEDDTLRFLENIHVPFTNNQGERDLRMTKVQQKISGCFRSFEGAEVFCRIRSYISTCQKHDVGIGTALECLFDGKCPAFIQKIIDSG